MLSEYMACGHYSSPELESGHANHVIDARLDGRCFDSIDFIRRRPNTQRDDLCVSDFMSIFAYVYFF